MKTSVPVAVSAAVVLSLGGICTAADLLDAPGPGYRQQAERLSPSSKLAIEPRIHVVPRVQIYSAPNALSIEPLTGIDETFSEANRLFELSSPVVKTGTGVLQLPEVPRKP